MSFGDPNNPYGQQPQGQQPGYGYPQQAPQGVPPQQGYGYPAAPPYGAPGGYPGGPGAPMGYGTPPLAHWGWRALSRLIDSAILLVPYYVLIGIGAGVSSSDGSNSATAVLTLIGAIYIIGMFFFQVYQEGSTGQTIGKKAVGTRTLRESTGAPLGFGMAFLRQLAHFVDSIACYLGYLWPIWDGKKQTFADKICSTVVVKENR